MVYPPNDYMMEYSQPVWVKPTVMNIPMNRIKKKKKNRIKLWGRIVLSPISVNPRLTKAKTNMSPLQLACRLALIEFRTTRGKKKKKNNKKNTQSSRYAQVNTVNQAHVDVPSMQYFVSHSAWTAQKLNRTASRSITFL